MNIQKIQYWLAVALWMIFIFWMSTGTSSAKNTSSDIFSIVQLLFGSIAPELIRKLAHIAEYFVLGILLFRAFFAQSIKIQNWECPYYSLLVVLLYACCDELHQSIVYARNASFPEIAIDTLGGILAIGACVLWRLYKSHNKKTRPAEANRGCIF